MPQMGELNEMVFVDRSGGPPVLSSPSLNSPPEDRQPSMASPGGSHDDDNTINSLVSSQSTSRSNSKTRHKSYHPGDFEMVDVNHRRGVKSMTDAGITTDEETLNQTLESAGNRIVTLTGTIKRGQKGGEVVQVQLQLSQSEINKLSESFIEDDKSDTCLWGLKKGLHILLFTVVFIPFAFIASLCVSFYIGTMAWYNLYLYLSEERTVWHKIFLSPLLILFFPFLIGFSSLGIALYGCVKQVSWHLSSWLKEIRDLEKGFFGWLCRKMQVPQCSPYEVVVLDEATLPVTGEPKTPQHTATDV